MDISIIPNFSIRIFSLNHKSFTSLSTVKLYFQKKIIHNIFWIYANPDQTARHAPLTPKTKYKNCSLCRRSIYISLLCIILLSVSLLLNCLRGGCALTSSQKAGHTHRPMLSHHPAWKNMQNQNAGCLTLFLQAQGAHGHSSRDTLIMLQVTRSFFFPCSKAVSSYVATVIWH